MFPTFGPSEFRMAMTSESPTPGTSAQESTATEKGIVTSPDVTNIPQTMIPNQYGLAGLLSFVRSSESQPHTNFDIGQDVRQGMDMESVGRLYPTFAGPWAEEPCRIRDLEFHHNSSAVGDRLPPIRFSTFNEEALFVMFYFCVGNVLQLLAASELYDREWRYHTEEQMWIHQPARIPAVERSAYGAYFFFDPYSWREVRTELRLDYSKLEGRPQIPPHLLM